MVLSHDSLVPVAGTPGVAGDSAKGRGRSGCLLAQPSVESLERFAAGPVA
jgi:hypothetical protein